MCQIRINGIFSLLFTCVIQKKSVPLHREPAPKGVWHQRRRVADILKRRLLTLCSDESKSRKFPLVSELSNGRCPTGYRLSLLCLLVRLLHIHICAHAYLNYVAREYIYIRRGLRVVGLIQRAMRRPKSMERQQSDSTLFLYA